jgi:hypothetical protein
MAESLPQSTSGLKLHYVGSTSQYNEHTFRIQKSSVEMSVGRWNTMPETLCSFPQFPQENGGTSNNRLRCFPHFVSGSKTDNNISISRLTL